MRRRPQPCCHNPSLERSESRMDPKIKQQCAMIQCPRNSHYRGSSRDKEKHSKWGKLEFYPHPLKNQILVSKHLLKWAGSKSWENVRFHIYERYIYRMSYIKCMCFDPASWKRKRCLASSVTFKFTSCHLWVLGGDWIRSEFEVDIKVIGT